MKPQFELEQFESGFKGELPSIKEIKERQRKLHKQNILKMKSDKQFDAGFSKNPIYIITIIGRLRRFIVRVGGKIFKKIRKYYNEQKYKNKTRFFAR